MKKIILMSTLIGMFYTVNAQDTEDEFFGGYISPQTHTSTDPSFNGFTYPINEDRMIPPHALEVTFDKTVHIIFPSAVSYVDLGSSDLIAGKANGAENVVRVKAAVKGFKNETNLAVITDAGNFYTFNVRYSDEPQKLNIEMKDFIHDGSSVNRPNNSMEIYLRELGNESPKIVNLIMSSIHQTDKAVVKHIGSKLFGVQATLKGIYSHNGFLFFYTQIKNSTNVAFNVDFITFKIVDKKVAKRTAIQEQVIYPIRAFNYVTSVLNKSEQRTVFALNQFTIPNDKQLVIEIFEKNGGRHQRYVVENEDIVRALVIDNLKVQ